MLNLSEKFLIYLFIWLFLLLGILSFVTFFVFIRKKNLDSFIIIKNPFQSNLKKKMPKEKNARNVVVSGLFKEKLGEKVVKYMVEVSVSDNFNLVKDRINRIREECERLNSLKLPEESKRIISTVLLWAKHFDANRHISEMRIFKKDTQILYDPEKHDFQLRISME